MRALRRRLPLCLLAVASAASAVERFPFDSNEIGLDAYAIIRRFVSDSQDRIKELDTLMTTPCVSVTVADTQALFKKVQKDWDDILTTQQEAFNSEIKAAEGEYGKHRANKTRRTGKPIEHRIVRRFPNEEIYSKWLEPSKEQWEWLYSGGPMFFKVVKRFEAQTALNVISVTNAKDTFEYLEELCRELHDALEAAQADPSKENIQACNNLKTYPTMVTKVWQETNDEVDTFVQDRKPENYAADKALVHDWILPADAFCVEYKTKWATRVKDQYSKYEKSFKAVKIAFTAIRAGGFMHNKMPIFSGWGTSDFQSRFDRFVATLGK